ncbi:MAG: glycoside hydrolase family 108 protein [Idiomarina sp.]|nr:glycoside hydrolase family 108 protein [Idiomarina sp.]
MSDGIKDYYTRLEDEEFRAENTAKSSSCANYNAFTAIFDRVIAHEGGYVDHPSDPGGATNFGITERTAREYGYAGKMEDLTLTHAKDIYYRGYWKRSGADSYHPAIGFQVFDAAVNHGIGNAIRMLQRAAGVADDGIVGPITQAAIKETDQALLIKRFAAERLDFYSKLRHFDQFGRGWTRRVAENLRHAAQDVQGQ